MDIVVLIKEVPDMERVRFDSERGVIDRASAGAEMNPFDMNALQAAVELRNRVGSGCITALTMGPPKAQQTLREAYARGADRCVLLSDRGFGGADVLATSATLAAAVRKLGRWDVVFCGEKSVDGDTAQVGPEVAEALGVPHCCYVEALPAFTSTTLDATVENIGGQKQTRRMQLPALVSVTKNITWPKLPQVRRKLESVKIEVETWGLADLAGFLLPEHAGSAGSATKVVKIVVPPPQQKQSQVFRGDYAAFSAAFLGAVR